MIGRLFIEITTNFVRRKFENVTHLQMKIAETASQLEDTDRYKLIFGRLFSLQANYAATNFIIICAMPICLTCLHFVSKFNEIFNVWLTLRQKQQKWAKWIISFFNWKNVAKFWWKTPSTNALLLTLISEVFNSFEILWKSLNEHILEKALHEALTFMSH